MLCNAIGAFQKAKLFTLSCAASAVPAVVFLGVCANALASEPELAPATQTETASQNASPGAAKTAAGELVPSNLIRLGHEAGFYSPFAFLVDKHERTLSVWKQSGDSWLKVASFPADMGRQEGVKTKRNDRRTPEGIYFLRTRLDGPGLDFNLYGSRAFTTDYPNFFDRLDGKTGDGIWLHAVPDKVALTRGSRGCVVVRNDVIKELTKYVDLGKTPVVISDKIEYVNPASTQSRETELTAAIESWRKAWEAKDIENYIAFYSEAFHAQKMDREKWKAYKTALNKTYKQFTVKLSRPYVVADKDQAVARFMQSYASDLHQDFGEKTLYLKRENGAYRIVGEEWAAESSPIAKQEMNSEPLAAPASVPGGAAAADQGAPLGAPQSASTN